MKTAGKRQSQAPTRRETRRRQPPREPRRRVRLVMGFATVGLLSLCLACANIQGPSGGPEDTTPPRLLLATPDSGEVALQDVSRLRLLFSEKMDRQPAEGWLFLYPPVGYEKTKWHGAREAEVILAEPLPPDTVVVVEIGTGMRDAHRVASRHSRRFPIATGAALPAGEITGSLVQNEQPLPGALVELFPEPPDTLKYYQQPILRRAVADSAGRFRLRWLTLPGGPWVIRACADDNHDLRAGEGEAQRLLPTVVRIDTARTSADLGVTVLYDPDTPGLLRGSVDTTANWPGTVHGWTMAITEEDTGWVAAPQPERPRNQQVMAARDSAVLRDVPPGLNRLVVFVDADGDSLLSSLPARRGVTAHDGTATGHFLEPHVVVDSLLVEPGLERDFTAPAFPDSLTPWLPPAATAADTRDGAAASDGGTSPAPAAPDSNRVGE